MNAVDLIYDEQPLHRALPAEDPLVILNALDNTDKHEELSPAFVYADVARGVDLIEVLDRTKVKVEETLWIAGADLEDGTLLARYLINGEARRVVRANDAARLGFATGKIGSARANWIASVDPADGPAHHSVIMRGARPVWDPELADDLERLRDWPIRAATFLVTRGV